MFSNQKPQFEPWHLIFFTIWFCLSWVWYRLFVVKKDAQFKRRHFPWFMTMMGTLFGGFILMLGFGADTLFFIMPALVLVVIWYIRATAFCDRCGCTIHPPNGFTRAAFCPHCGAELVN